MKKRNSIERICIRAERKRKLVEEMGGCCSKCGYSKNLAALDFHHKNSDTKKFCIAEFTTILSFEHLQEEAKKCVILCRNCHAEQHNPILKLKITNKGLSFEENQLNDVNVYCKNCGKYSGGGNYCSQKCGGFARRKVVRPSKEELKNLIGKFSLTEIGKQYSVSDNAVRKWAKKYNIL
jgi:hypothetical protein